MQQPSTTGSRPFEQRAYLKRCEAISKVLVDYFTVSFEDTIDLGCGSGLVGLALLEAWRPWGGNVFFLDGRKEHTDKLSIVGNCAMPHDAQEPLPHKADLILCCGLLYHSEHPEKILANCTTAVRPDGALVVETLCMDRASVWFLSFEESVKRVDQSVDGGCCRFSPDWLERELHRLGYSKIVDLSAGIPDIPGDGYHLGFRYNWDLQDSGDSYRDGYGLRKLWVAWK